MAESKIPKYGHRDKATTTLTSSNFYNGFSAGEDGSVKYIVKSGICYVTIRKCQFTQAIANTDQTIFDGLPSAPSGNNYYFMFKASNSDIIFRGYVQTNAMKNLVTLSSSSDFLNKNIYATFNYPVSDSWTT